MVRVKENLSKKQFGLLTVIEQADDYIANDGKHYAQWKCKCDCQNIITVLGRSLKSGHTKSCGCLHNQQSIYNGKNNKKYNIYDLSSEYGIGYTTKGEPFYFDLEDYDKIKDYCWNMDDKGYIMHIVTSGGCIRIHRLIMNCPSNMIIDHMNHNKADNRKVNLRICTYNENTKNNALRKDNISGVTGVSFCKRNGKWVANICVNRKIKFLGYFSNFDDAVKARKNAEEIYYGEFSYDNSMKNSIKHQIIGGAV